MADLLRHCKLNIAHRNGRDTLTQSHCPNGLPDFPSPDFYSYPQPTCKPFQNHKLIPHTTAEWFNGLISVLPMKVYGLLTGSLGLLVLTSCSSVRKLSDKDSRVTTTMAKKQKGNAPREFLDMEVTPGGQPANQQAKVAVNRSATTPVKNNILTVPVSNQSAKLVASHRRQKRDLRPGAARLRVTCSGRTRWNCRFCAQ